MHGAAASTALGLSLASSPASPTPMCTPLFAAGAVWGDYIQERCKRDICTKSCNVFSAVWTEPAATTHLRVACRAGLCRSLHHLTSGQNVCGQNGAPWFNLTGFGSQEVKESATERSLKAISRLAASSLAKGYPNRFLLSLRFPSTIGETSVARQHGIQVNDIETATHGALGVVLRFTCWNINGATSVGDA